MNKNSFVYILLAGADNVYVSNNEKVDYYKKLDRVKELMYYKPKSSK
jgi:hypothetical protein